MHIRHEDPITLHMRTDVNPLRMGQTVGEVLAELRAHPPEERIHYFYVVDEEGRIRGVVPTRRMLISGLDQPIETVMIPRVVTLPETATVLDACEMFTLHKFLAFPVVDREGRLRGVVDVGLYTDEVTDLAERSAVEEMFQLVGVRLEQARLGGPGRAAWVRFPWLLCNVAGGILAALLSGMFQEVLDRYLVLALFIPVVLTLSESVAIQSVSLAVQTIRGGSRGGNGGIVLRELATGVLLGLACGMIVAGMCWGWKGQAPVALVLLSAIMVAMAVSAVVGLVMPGLLERFRGDPRVAAGPIALVLADLATLGVYYGLGTALLR
jgi:magnesium transporter